MRWEFPVSKMSPCQEETSSYAEKENCYLYIFPLYFIFYPLQLYQTACHWVTNSYKRCKKPIQEGSQFQFETLNHKPGNNFMKKASVIEQVLELLIEIRKGGNEDDVRSVLSIVSTFLEWNFPQNLQSTAAGNSTKLGARHHKYDSENIETFANSTTSINCDSTKDDEIVSGYEKKLGNGKNTVLLEESGKITEAVESTSLTCSDFSIGCQVEKKTADPAELPEFVGLSGEGKITNVQKNGVQVESAGKGENSSPAGNVTPSCTSDEHGGIGNGGSDGDGDGDDEPHIRDSNLPNGHYEESLVPQGTSNHCPLSPVENDTDLPDEPFLSTHDSGLNNVAISSDHNGRRQSEEPIKIDGVQEQMDVDGHEQRPRNHVDIAHDGHPTISNTSTMPLTVLGSPYDLDLSGQACYISTNSSSGNQAQTFKESLPSQTILSPLNEEVLAVEKDGTYREHHNFISRDFAGAGRFGKCDFCQDKKTHAWFVRKTIMRRSEFNESEIISWRELNNSPGLNRRNILTLFGALEENQHVFLFMECMSGSLADIVNMLSLSEKEVVVISKQVLQGLCFLHEKGIIHRDVKCENMFYNTDTFDIKIGDFGLACALNEELVVRNDRFCGTAHGMAYEVCKSLPYGRSSDMWSFACVVIHLITGRMPWSDCENHFQIIYKVGSGSIPQLPSETECSLELNQLLLNLFSKDPAQRATAKQLLRHSIFNSMSESQFEDELICVFRRILEHRYSPSEEPSDGNDLALSVMEEIIDGSSPMSLSGPDGPDHEMSSDEPQDDFAKHDDQEVNEGTEGD